MVISISTIKLNSPPSFSIEQDIYLYCLFDRNGAGCKSNIIQLLLILYIRTFVYLTYNGTAIVSSAMLRYAQLLHLAGELCLGKDAQPETYVLPRQ